jgi:hypothetical protein
MNMLKKAVQKFLYNKSQHEETEQVKAEILTNAMSVTHTIKEIDHKIRQTTAYRIGRATGGFR